jgi:hypothetical protein
MPDLQRALVIGDAPRLRLRGSGVLLASAGAHLAVLLGIFLFGSPRLLATVPPEAIVVDIVRPEEIGSELKETAAGPKQEQQARQQQQPQQQQPQQQQPQQQPPQLQPQQQAQAQPAPADATAPVFTSLYPWPVARPANDTQAGDYRTFESTGKLEHSELAALKARLKQCWKPPAGARKLTAAVRVALRIDGSLAGPPELVEATASPYGPALVESVMRAVNQCGPYGFLPADSYDTWKRLSLTFSPDDVQIAALTQ